MTHEGWRNYETWCIALWINNDRTYYEKWCKEVANMPEGPHGQVRDTLADKLKEWVEKMRPATREGVWADLMSAALSEVDWHEIADDLMG